jgi:hypothetical protein
LLSSKAPTVQTETSYKLCMGLFLRAYETGRSFNVCVKIISYYKGEFLRYIFEVEMEKGEHFQKSKV